MKALIFGALGSIGNYIFQQFTNDKIETIGTTTSLEKVTDKIIFVNKDNLDNLLTIDNLDIVIWAHGYNFNDNISNFDEIKFTTIIDANVTFILSTLNLLIKHNKINNNAKMVIVSSIWEEFSRENKLSYSISKAALSGLVKNIAFDLSSKNILVNNILPGVIDNEMSQKTLLPEQFEYIKTYMNFGRLISLDDVYKTIKFFTIDNTGITGQSIKVDLGFTNFRKYN
jgi:NAD(P)-dependent dehydrogenase (short-subunit alcohol dehydrogenase family)